MTSEVLFRFVTIRHPMPTGRSRLKLARPAAVGSDDRAEALEQLSSLDDSETLIRNPSEIPRAQQLFRFRERLLEDPPPDAPLSTIAETLLGEAPDELVRNDDWRSIRRQLNDSLLVFKLIPDDRPRPLKQVADLIRTMAVVDALASESLDVETARRLLNAGLQIPAVFGRSRSLSQETQERARVADQIREKARAVVRDLIQLGAVNRALRELRSIERLADSRNEPRDTSDRPLLGLAGANLLSADAINLLSATGAGAPAAASIEELRLRLEGERSRIEERVSSIRQARTPARLVSFGGLGVRIPTGFEPISGAPETESASMAIVGAELGEALSEVAADPGLSRLADDVRFGLDREVRARLGRWAAEEARRQGGPSLLAPSGRGVLRLVRQELLRYEPGEVAHIENVLQGELRRRTHTRRVSTEQIFVEEEERQTAEERDLQTTERGETRREINEQARREQESSAGITISADYGRVEVEASAELSARSSEEESSRTATETAREIVDRAVNKISERVLRRRETRLLEQLEEINLHEFENQAADATPRVGVYQWVNKIYRAQVFNYGERTWYDMIIPEPAVFLLHAAAQGEVGSGTTVPDPGDFAATYDAIEERYADWMVEYGATGLKPPPARTVAITKTFSAVGEDPLEPARNFFAAADRIKLPDGFEAIRAIVGFTNRAEAREKIPLIGVTVEGISRQFKIETAGLATGSLPSAEGVEPLIIDLASPGVPGPRGEVAVGLTADDFSALSFTFTLECERTNELLEAWRLDTFSALHQAYLQRKAEYQDALSRLELREAGAEGISVSANPLRTQQLIATELKRAAITLMSNEPPEYWPIIYPPAEKPRIAFDVVRRGLERMGRFMEQAFEWHNMTYLFYPYYWGRPDRWEFRVLYEDADPLLAEFIRAGAARVLIPVRHGWEEAVDHFMMTKEPFFGGDLPPIGDGLHLDFVDEAAEILGRPREETPESEPWEVTIPTSLVLLRTGPGLPDWSE